MTDSSELHRYIEYLQRTLLSPEVEDAFNHEKYLERLRSERGRQRVAASWYSGRYGDGLVAEYEKNIATFVPETEFETFNSRGIFQPIVDEVKDLSERSGDGLSLDLSIATSTSSSPGPFARPSSDHHLLFIGPGTYTFCNYWAKAYASIVNTIAADAGRQRMGPDYVADWISANPHILELPTKLAFYQATAGTLLGFGEVPEPPEFFCYRAELLKAMEVFVVGHEYGHFLAEEREPAVRGQLDRERGLELEVFCDRYGASICHRSGANHHNWLAFTGAGPILLFRDEIRPDRSGSTTGRGCGMSEGHPPLQGRIQAVRDQVLNGTQSDQRQGVTNFLDEFDGICDAVEESVQDVCQNVMEELT